ncbi:MAG: 3-carboxy-cis,cis-muconate cycloisomerase [Nitratireductor sp.]|nr:3-carboxy-cis,cis-muconate cycloisomerase [Nitratireductor sp.]
MSFTPFNAPLLSGLLGDREATAFFTVKAELDCMIGFEIALAKAQAGQGVIPSEAAGQIENALHGFEPDITAIGAETARDGVVVPELVRQMRNAVGKPHAERLHFGTTSQDLIDTSFIMRIKSLLILLESRIEQVESILETLQVRFGGNFLMGRTRMQAALPITVADRLASWRTPFAVHRQRLGELKPRLFRLQFGGAVGTLDRLGDKAQAVADDLARRLDLGAPDRSWHTDRSAIAELANWLSLVTGSLGKIGQDVALMAQNERGEVALSGGGGSSAMPHKQNPVLAEALVTLARFNATQLAGLHHALVHEQERSGSAWTLEWMLMPQVAIATAASLRNAIALLRSVEGMGEEG